MTCRRCISHISRMCPGHNACVNARARARTNLNEKDRRGGGGERATGAGETADSARIHGCIEMQKA